MTITLSALQKQRYDTAANWTAENPTLLAGEIGVESDTGKIKIGTGATAWTSLSYSGLIPGSGVYPYSQLLMPSGTAGAPSISFDGDGDTGIYRTGANAVAISTNGTGVLFVDASGNVGIGNSSQTSYNGSADNLVIGSSGSNGITIASSDTGAGYIMFADGTTGQQAYEGQITYDHTNNYLSFNTSAIERLRIDSSGRIGLGTSTPSANLESQGNVSSTTLFSGFQGLRIQNANGSAFGVSADINFVVGTGSDNRGAAIGAIYDSATSGNHLYFATNGSSVSSNDTLTERLRITAAGNVGIGTSSPVDPLHVVGSSSGGLFEGAVQGVVTVKKTGTNGVSLISPAAGVLQIYDNNGSAERARIDSSGRLLVGTSSAFSASNDAQYGRIQVLANSFSSTSQGIISIGRGAAATSITTGEAIGQIHFTDNTGNIFANIECSADATAGSGDYPGRLVFSTTADGASSPTERMRLGSSGYLKVSNSGSYVASGTNTHEFNSDQTAPSVLRVHASSASYSNSVIYGTTAATTTNGNANLLYLANGNTSGACFVQDSGDVKNTNNSYGAISDIKLKENIVDANSQWNDLKALQVRNYNFKEGQTHTQIGLIAQEVELVSPGLVSESPDRDEDGNDLGTVTKSVNYSVLYMKAVKALQEAMERIEVLEQRLSDAGIA